MMSDQTLNYTVHLREVNLSTSSQNYEDILIICSFDGRNNQNIKNVSKFGDLKYKFHF